MFLLRQCLITFLLTQPQPSTATSGTSKSFKKFKDLQIKSATKNQAQKSIIKRKISPAQMQSRRVVRSLKKQQQSLSKKTPKKNLHRKLNFSIEMKNDKQKKQNETVEEGEIVDDDDEDCVVVEPEVVQIDLVGEDTTFLSQEVTVIENCNKNELQPSTPCLHKPDAIVTSTPIVPPVANAERDDLQLFFTDVQKRPAAFIPMYDTITSEDTFANYPSDVVEVIDVTLKANTSNSLKRKHSEAGGGNSKTSKCADLDDSVVFVSEERPPSIFSFIPLRLPPELAAQAKNFEPKESTPKRPIPKNNLLTASEQKNLQTYSSNMYNPNANEQASSKKRMIIVDGSNVAFGHGLSKSFSVKGLKICLEYFEKKGHDVKIVVPQFRLQISKSTEPEVLNNLYKEGKVLFTPCKSLPGKSSSSYDDRFILQLAAELDAAIVSNDNYRDLLNENNAFKKIIENRVVGYTWCNDMLILPMDPYGRWGPSLDSILNRQ